MTAVQRVSMALFPTSVVRQKEAPADGDRPGPVCRYGLGGTWGLGEAARPSDKLGMSMPLRQCRSLWRGWFGQRVGAERPDFRRVVNRRDWCAPPARLPKFNGACTVSS